MPRGGRLRLFPIRQAEQAWEAWQSRGPLLVSEQPGGQMGDSQTAPEASMQTSPAPIGRDSTSLTVPRVVPTQIPSRYWTTRRLAVALLWACWSFC